MNYSEILNLCNKTNKSTRIKYVLLHINYQHVSIALAVMRVALQEHKEYNKPPIFISGTTQHYNRYMIRHILYYVHLLVLVHEFKYSLIQGHGKY